MKSIPREMKIYLSQNVLNVMNGTTKSNGTKNSLTCFHE